jgi:hypothetical protein
MRNIIFQERERKFSSRITVPGRKVMKKERNNFSFDTEPGFEFMTFHFAIPDSYHLCEHSGRKEVEWNF